MNNQDIQTWDEHSKREAVRAMPESTSHIRRWLRELTFRNCRRLLDIGAGIGEDTKFASDLGFDAEGIEISQEAVKIARTQGVTMTEGDFTDMLYPDETFDVCIAGGSIEHVPNTEDVLKEIHRVMKPGGTFLFNVPYRWTFFVISKKLQQIFGIWKCGYEQSFTKSQITNLLDKNGFEVLDIDWSEVEIGKHPFLSGCLHYLDKIISGKHHIWCKCKKREVQNE